MGPKNDRLNGEKGCCGTLVSDPKKILTKNKNISNFGTHYWF
jgi:hypothetical protein